jgi:anti-sigma factor RsiW
MTNRFDCDDKDTLVSYLYGEASLDARRAVEAHLDRCPPCAREVQELRGARATLAAWIPPDAELGFRIIREPAAAAPRRWWQMPAWAPVALAAGLVLALAASVEVEYGSGAVTIRTGWARAASTVAQSPTPVPAGLTDSDLQAALVALEGKLRAELAATGAREAAPAAPVRLPAASVDRGELLRQVEDLIEASERRQQRELAFRLAQVVQDVDAQRRTDMLRIETGLGQIEGVTGQEVARQRQLINYLMQARDR